jgi:hypothetical protein
VTSVLPLMMHAEQLVAFGSVGNVEALVATVTQYRFAPLTLDQLNVGFTDIPAAAFDGADNAGAVSNEELAVVKLKMLE